MPITRPAALPLLILVLFANARADYTGTVLYKVSGPNGSDAYGLYYEAEGQITGYYYDTSPTYRGYHAVLWSGPNGSTTDLNPSEFTTSYALSSDVAQQVGWGYSSATGNKFHAVLWSGTADSAVDLNPSGYTFSEAVGIYGNQQVGWGTAPDGYTHALLWTGNAASAVDLGANSQALETDGTQQVGYVNLMTQGETHASLWSGTAASAVDLNPSGYYSSEAVGIGGTQQVGNAETLGNYSHAMLWTGTAASAVDLNPSGFQRSSAVSTNGTQQVGWGYVNEQTSLITALLWMGTSASVIDLQSLLPTNDTWGASSTTYIDSSGNIFGWTQDLAGNFFAVEWSPILLGDFNRDGHVNAADILAMEQALTNLPAYQSANSLSNAQLLEIGDINGDGVVNNADLQALLNLLQSGGGSLNSVPEPSAFLLAVLAFGLWGFRRRLLGNSKSSITAGLQRPAVAR